MSIIILAGERRLHVQLPLRIKTNNYNYSRTGKQSSYFFNRNNMSTFDWNSRLTRANLFPICTRSCCLLLGSSCIERRRRLRLIKRLIIIRSYNTIPAHTEYWLRIDFHLSSHPTLPSTQHPIIPFRLSYHMAVYVLIICSDIQDPVSSLYHKILPSCQ